MSRYNSNAGFKALEKSTAEEKDDSVKKPLSKPVVLIIAVSVVTIVLVAIIGVSAFSNNGEGKETEEVSTTSQADADLDYDELFKTDETESDVEETTTFFVNYTSNSSNGSNNRQSSVSSNNESRVERDDSEDNDNSSNNNQSGNNSSSESNDESNRNNTTNNNQSNNNNNNSNQGTNNSNSNNSTSRSTVSGQSNRSNSSSQRIHSNGSLSGNTKKSNNSSTTKNKSSNSSSQNKAKSSTSKQSSSQSQRKTTVVDVNSVSVSRSTLTLYVGSSDTIHAAVQPTNATNKNITWSSHNNAVATVNGGKIYGVSKGTAVIFATSNNGKKAICTVTVKEKEGKIRPTSNKLSVGKTTLVTVIDAKVSKWVISNPFVLQIISHKGEQVKVKGLKAGVANVEAHLSNGKVLKCKINVVK